MATTAPTDRASPSLRTRFAPAPTGYLHLGHVANAINVWGMARARGGEVLLRIEDHDRQRCRPAYDAALIEDLDWLGFLPDSGPVRQSDDDGPYEDALATLRAADVAYGCDCSRRTFADWGTTNGRAWRGPGCPGGCRGRRGEVPETTIRVAIGGGSETWMDAFVGPCGGEVAPAGDTVIRDRHGNWSYAFAVVVDDRRQDIDLVVRGLDLLEATPAQIRLGRFLGRERPPTFAHHRLIRRPDGRKLSKADGATSVRELRAAGRAAEDLIGEAALAIGRIEVRRAIAASDVGSLFPD